MFCLKISLTIVLVDWYINGDKTVLDENNRIMLEVGMEQSFTRGDGNFIVIHVYYGYSYCRTNFAVIKSAVELYSGSEQVSLVKC